jgi:hypothetical protein
LPKSALHGKHVPADARQPQDLGRETVSFLSVQRISPRVGPFLALLLVFNNTTANLEIGQHLESVDGGCGGIPIRFKLGTCTSFV